MSIRLEYWRAAPDEFKTFMLLERQLKAAVGNELFDLLCLRVSQMNGCPFCVDLHADELRKAGASDKTLDSLVAWKDSPFFSAAERAALDWAEQLTEVSKPGRFEEAYAELHSHFEDKRSAALTFTVALINALNRIAIGFARKPARKSEMQRPALRERSV